MVTAPAWSQLSQVCQQFEWQIRTAEMNLAAELADGFGDNSAPRETNRQLRYANSWASVQTHLGLMAANKCPLFSRPITATTYLTAALECATARLKAEKDSPKCRRNLWKADPPPSAPE
jgi:hypothetical protein